MLTRSLCAMCLKECKAEIIFKREKAFLQKNCETCGKSLSLHVWDSEKLFKFMMEKEKCFLHQQPNGIIVDVTDECNLSCSFCFGINTYTEKLGVKHWNEIIKQIKEARRKLTFSTVYLFGGEPTLHKDLLKIIREIKKMGLKVCLFTNGVKLSDKKFVEILVKSGLDFVTFSFDSFNDEFYKQVRGIELFQRKIKALENLRRKNIPVNLFTIILKNLNEKEIKRICELPLSYRNIKNIYFSSLTSAGKCFDKFFSLSNSKRVKLIEKELNVNIEDIFYSTLFENITTNFIQKLTKKPIGHDAPFCDISCYFYLTSNALIPLSKVINLKLLIERLKKNIQQLKIMPRILVFFYLFSSISLDLLKKRLGQYPAIFILLLFQFFNGMLKGFLRRQIKFPFSTLCKISITQFQDRFNVDLKTFDGCNLFAICSDGSIRPYCEKIIYKL